MELCVHANAALSVSHLSVCFIPAFVSTGLLIMERSSPQVHVKSESLAIKISQEINYAKSLYYEQQLMLPASENEDCLLLES